MALRTRSLTITGLLVTTLLLAACTDDVGSGISTTGGGDRTTTTAEEVDTTTTRAPETTTTRAPETTTTSSATATTTAPDSEAGEDDSTTGLLIVLGIILLVVVIIALNASRRSKEAEASAAGTTAAATGAAPAWKATADQAYSQSRWLYENLTPEIAQWRGDSLQKGDDRSQDPASDIASAQQQTWDQLGTQMTAATTTLYSLEPQVDSASQPVVRSVIDSLNHTRTAVDDVASARLAVDQATGAFQADTGNQRLQQDLSAAHDHENQSVQNLNSSRVVLQGALANLTALQ